MEHLHTFVNRSESRSHGIVLLFLSSELLNYESPTGEVPSWVRSFSFEFIKWALHPQIRKPRSLLQCPMGSDYNSIGLFHLDLFFSLKSGSIERI